MEWVRPGPPGIFLAIHVVNGEHALLEGAAMRLVHDYSKMR